VLLHILQQMMAGTATTHRIAEFITLVRERLRRRGRPWEGSPGGDHLPDKRPCPPFDP
jgi:hypothetical protein